MRADVLSFSVLLLSTPCWGGSELDVLDDQSPTESPAPSPAPSETPSLFPTTSKSPSSSPTYSIRPSLRPSMSPSNIFSAPPTESPAPSPAPSEHPSRMPSNLPSFAPSFSPTNSVAPSLVPSTSISPSWAPSAFPTLNPTRFSVTMSIPLKISLNGARRMKGDEIAEFQELVLQFLKDNVNLTHSDMEIEFLSAILEKQEKVQRELLILRNASDSHEIHAHPDLDTTLIVSAEVYDSSQEIDSDFDFQELVEGPFDRNMTAFLLLLTARNDKPTVDGVNGVLSQPQDDANNWIGILIICIASAILIIVLLFICCYMWKKRQVPFADFGKDVDTSESEEGEKDPVQRSAESWESEDSTGIKGLAANNATVDVHKCNSATCALCTKGKQNAPSFVRLTPRSVRWASIWQMTSPFNSDRPRSPSHTPKKSAMRSPLSRLGSKKVAFDA